MWQWLQWRAFPPDTWTWRASHGVLLFLVFLCLSSTAARAKRIYDGHSTPVRLVGFSSDGKILASASEDSTVILWDMATGKALRTFSAELPDHQYQLPNLLFSPDLKLFVSPRKLWDVGTGRVLRALTDDRGNRRVFSPDGKQLAAASFNETIRLWDVATGQLLITFEGLHKFLAPMAFSPDGKFLISGDRTGAVKMWDAATGRLLRTLNCESDVGALAVSPDARTLAVGGEYGNIQLWDVTTDQPQVSLKGHNNAVTSLGFSPDGKILASASRDHSVKLWDVATGKRLRGISLSQDENTSVAFSPDGKMLAWGDGLAVRLWDVAVGKLRATLQGHYSHVAAVAYSPNMKTLATAGCEYLEVLGRCRTGSLIVWETATGQRLHHIDASTEPSLVALSPDGKTLASGSHDETVKLWDVATGKLRTTLSDRRLVTSVAFSSQGKQLASGSYDKTAKVWTVRVWDVVTGKPLRAIQGHYTDYMNPYSVPLDVAFSPDGKILVSKLTSEVKLWDAATGKLLRTFSSTGLEVIAEFSPDGRTLITTSCDKPSYIDKPGEEHWVCEEYSAKLWDMATGRLRRKFPVSEMNGEMPISPSTLALSPDGKRLALADVRCVKSDIALTCASYAVVQWDVATGRRLATYQGYSEPVTSLAYSRDGKFLVSGSESEVILRDTATGKLLRTLP